MAGRARGPCTSEAKLIASPSAAWAWAVSASRRWKRLATSTNLRELSQFPGAYGAARYGAAFGDKGGGELWLENPQGVMMSLKARREGLAVSLGADAMVIAFK